MEFARVRKIFKDGRESPVCYVNLRTVKFIFEDEDGVTLVEDYYEDRYWGVNADGEKCKNVEDCIVEF